MSSGLLMAAVCKTYGVGSSPQPPREKNNDDKNSFYCKKGKHTIAYESEEFELVEI
jgi:hypothetical protein